MKSLMVITMTILLAACSTTTTTTTNTATTNNSNTESSTNQTLSLEQIAEKSQSTDSLLSNEELNVPAYINNTSRNTSKEVSTINASNNSTKKTTTK